MNGSSRDHWTSTEEKPSFFIRILYRQNASWQGEVQWMEGQKTKRFRSALELLALIQEAMDIAGAPEAGNRYRRWEEPEGDLKRNRYSEPASS